MQVHEWKPKTSTTNIREHFCKAHMADWVSACDKAGIEISGKTALQAVAEFRANPQTGQNLRGEGNKRLPFSDEAFVNALVDWIVSDDQVIHLFSYLAYLIIL